MDIFLENFEVLRRQVYDKILHSKAAFTWTDLHVQIFAYMQICPCEWICTCMQNMHHMQILEIFTWLRPSENFNLHICIYANLSM